MTPFDPYISQQASCRASLLVASAGFRSDDWADLKQEIVLDILRRSPKFDSTRGGWRGFVRGVVRNRAAELVVRKRLRAPEVLGLDLMNREDAADDDTLDVLDKRPSRAVDALQHSIDVRRMVERLPAQLRSLAVLLGEMPVRDLCRQTGKSRSRIYQMKKQIREAFLSAGLSPYNPKRLPEPTK